LGNAAIGDAALGESEGVDDEEEEDDEEVADDLDGKPDWVVLLWLQLILGPDC
jgi:hypothetical protein